MIKIPLLEEIAKDPKKLTIVTVASAGAVLAAFIFFLLMPQSARLGASAGRNAKAKAELANARYEIALMPKYRDDIAKFKEKVDIYEKKLPLEQEMPSILENMNAMAKKRRLDIIAITPVPSPGVKSDGAQKPAYQEFLIRISMRCGFHELGRILADMENADRFMKVVDIDIKSNDNTPKKHSVELLVATYILLRDKEKEPETATGNVKRQYEKR